MCGPLAFGAVTAATQVPATLWPWQLTQVVPEASAACTMPGGVVELVLAILNVVKAFAAWQASQATVPKGTWFAGGAFSGCAVQTPVNERPLAWQAAQLAVMPAWSMVHTANEVVDLHADRAERWSRFSARLPI